jgi:hypothetical protein
MPLTWLLGALIVKRRIFLERTVAVALTGLVSARVRAAGAAASTAARGPAIKAIVRAVLENIRTNGFNPDPDFNGGLGGLWINFRTASQPLQTNFSTAGVPYSNNKDGSKRHDELTDLRYLHNLWTCRAVFPDVPVPESEIARFTRIVKYELAEPKNERGWVYDLVFDLHRLSGDPFYRDAARGLARHFADELYKPELGTVCKIKKKNGVTTSSYRVDHALEIGCALVQAGTVYGESSWTQKGKSVIDFAYANAYLPQYRTFPSELDEVVLASGRLSPNLRFYRHGDTEGGSAKPPALGQIALGLLHAHVVTRDEAYLRRAVDLLAPLTATDNTLGLWDNDHGGYWDKTVFSGSHVRDAGTARVRKGDKEGARQLHLLQAFAVANRLTGGRFREMEEGLLTIALEKAYSPAGRGYVYLQAPDWSLLKAKQGGQRDWVTTEAMGIALEALLSLWRKETW